MYDDKPRRVLVVLTDDLAVRSLTAANAIGLSRSAWLRQLIESHLDQNGAPHD